jgi:preprotein translocase SecE subunit
MARNRQDAKQRQAERRAKRLAEQGTPEGKAPRRPAPPVDDPTTVEPSPAVSPELAAGAPPVNEGRSDAIFGHQPQVQREHRDYDHQPADEQEALQEIEDWEVGADDGSDEGDKGFAPRGRRGGGEDAPDRKRPRVVQFLVAVWAELQRVQWPDRQALTTLTGVVLGFVLIAGGYLGLLDAIVSRLVNAIL